MTKVLIYTSPARGHLYPMMDVALGLQGAGHDVTVQTLAGERDRVQAAGVAHRPIAPAIEAIELKDHEAGSPMAQLQASFGAWVARAPHEVEDLLAATTELEPDLLLVDANTTGAASFAETRGRSWAMFLPYALPVASRDTPAFGPGFPPPRHALDRLRDRIVWGMMAGATRKGLAELNRLRSELGVPVLWCPAPS